MSINFEYYRVFYQVAKLSSITLAAQSLYLSQPAVSQSIRQLEKMLGCSLFFRTQRGVRLTPEGETLFENVAPGCEQILLGEKRVAGMLNFEEGELRVGASEMTLRLYLLPYLEEFHKRYPKITMNVSNSTTPETIADLRAGKIDFGVVSGPIQEKRGLTVRPVQQMQDIFIAGRQFSQLRGRKLSLEELLSYPLICLEKGTSTRRYFEDYFQAQNLSFEPEFNLATTDLILPFVERGFGIGVVVRDFAKHKLETEEIFELATQQLVPPRQICVITGSPNQISKAGEAFLNQLFCRQRDDSIHKMFT